MVVEEKGVELQRTATHANNFDSDIRFRLRSLTPRKLHAEYAFIKKKGKLSKEKIRLNKATMYFAYIVVGGPK